MDQVQLGQQETYPMALYARRLKVWAWVRAAQVQIYFGIYVIVEHVMAGVGVWDDGFGVILFLLASVILPFRISIPVSLVFTIYYIVRYKKSY